jgi:hypothetical protein
MGRRSGETRDYMGICFPVNECKASLFAAHGTCKGTSEAPKPKCTTVNGEQQCTISAPKYTGSPIPGKNILNATKNFFTSVPSCKEGPAPGIPGKCKLVQPPGKSVGP